MDAGSIVVVIHNNTRVCITKMDGTQFVADSEFQWELLSSPHIHHNTERKVKCMEDLQCPAYQVQSNASASTRMEHHVEYWRMGMKEDNHNNIIETKLEKKKLDTFYRRAIAFLSKHIFTFSIFIPLFLCLFFFITWIMFSLIKKLSRCNRIPIPKETLCIDQIWFFSSSVTLKFQNEISLKM